MYTHVFVVDYTKFNVCYLHSCNGVFIAPYPSNIVLFLLLSRIP